MTNITSITRFDFRQIAMVNNAVAMAEELVSNYYKMSASQWLHPKYDVKTLADLSPEEVVQGPFAQVIRYKGRQKGKTLETASYDFYKICLQDHSILKTLQKKEELLLFPFCLYIVTHELIHIVRFSKFLQNFDASEEEKFREETRVHEITRNILEHIQISGLENVLSFYGSWQIPIDGIKPS